MTVSSTARHDTARLALHYGRTMSVNNLFNTFLAPVVVAVGETVILLHPPLPLVGVSIAMKRQRQQNDSLANG